MFSGIASLGRVAPNASVPKSAFGLWARVCELRVRGTSAVLILAALNSSAFAHVGAHTSGTELPQPAAALVYGSGFVGATLVLHALGLALGSLSRGAAFAPRAAGAMGAAVGAVLLVMA
jgi:hydrogenase/urease accessory protein HupE